MILVQVFMVPQGTGPRRLLTQATLSCVGEATRDLPEAGVTKGSRAYRVVLHKDTAFGGPGEDADLRGARPWKTGTVVGHRPGPRGVWDLLGGALRAVLGSRLDGYSGAAVGLGPVTDPHDESPREFAAQALEDFALSGRALLSEWQQAQLCERARELREGK